MTIDISFLLKDQGVDANTTDMLPDWLEKARKVLILKRGTMEMAREIIMKKEEYSKTGQPKVLKKIINFWDGLERNALYKT